jgi:hypothetical protein
VVNVPGSPKAAVESLAAREPTNGHALETLAGPDDHGVDGDVGGTQSDAPNPAPATTPSAAPAAPDVDTAEDWVPKSDDNDEWRDLPERGSR